MTRARDQRVGSVETCDRRRRLHSTPAEESREEPVRWTRGLVALLLASGGVALMAHVSVAGEQHQRGIRGAIADEPPGTVRSSTTAEVSSRDRLTLMSDYLAARGARRIEDLKDADVLAIMEAPAVVAPWRARLAQLAREEVGRRYLTNDRFPSPAMLDVPQSRAPMTLSASDLEVLARIVKGEIWHDCFHDGMVAVASVV